VRRPYAPALAVFLILLGSYAFFWHTRDWNTASRLMLTYALVDRGTVEITGLEQHTGDLAKYNGRYYSDKLPGYPLLAAVPYACLRGVFGFPPHPLNVPAKEHWAVDYWVTLATSGLFTAWTAALLVLLARDVGCTPASSIFVGLAYGLATPAYVYATLAYGHQASAFALLASFLLIWKQSPRFEAIRLGVAGFLAALASVIELQMAPISAILGFYLLGEILGRHHRLAGLWTFALGAALPTLMLLGYNQIAFDSPWRMGYFYEVNFGDVHTAANPLALKPPDWGRLGPLLWGRYRGLFFHAPILVLALPGWVALLVRRRWALAIVSFMVCASVLLVNLAYPQWTGGWSTGPRLLVPLIPFAMIPIAALLAERGVWANAMTVIAVALVLIGGLQMLLFQGAGGRIPNEVWDARLDRKVPLAEPLRDAVWPLWTGKPLPDNKRYVKRFSRNLVAIAAPVWVKELPPQWRFLQMVPLVAFQCLAVAAALSCCSNRSSPAHEIDPAAD
jgi:hypothetical protein